MVTKFKFYFIIWKNIKVEYIQNDLKEIIYKFNYL